MDKIELLGGACFSHGPYTFYKAVRIGNGRVLRLGNFFLTKLWNDADLVSIGELQLLWMDSRGPNQPLASLRLYFLPENTPDGRRDTHGEDEVLTISEKVVVRVNDLITWLSPSLEWSCGREVSVPVSPTISPGSSPRDEDVPVPQVLTDPGIDFSDVEKQQKEYENNSSASERSEADTTKSRVVVLSYPRYCRYRALLRRLEGAEPSWLCSSVAAALGGFTALPGTRVLFCRDTFDYPDLETHELLCNHLAPKLKGRPRRKRKIRSTSPGESSNESEASVASTSKLTSTSIPGLRPPPSGVRRSERKTSVEEKRFVSDVQSFMNSRGTPVGKMPLLGYKQIDLYLFYTKVQSMGGYESVSAGRLWKCIYDEIGGNTGSTSAATITRRHYERLLLPFEKHQRGEETKVRPAYGRRSKTSSISEDMDTKQDSETSRESQSPPATNISETETSTIVTPPLQSILSTPLLPGDKPKSESSKISSLRSVRVKTERLKLLNTIIANTIPSATQVNQLPSPPPTSNTPATTPTDTPSTTPNSGQSVLERQLNSPLISQQVAPSTTPPGIPPPSNVNPTMTNASAAVVTLTPPPEKDLKELKLDPKQTTLLAQGKENIPLFGEKTIVAPRSPEVIDLETEMDTSRDKIIIPSFKKRKLEILREGGLEVTAVDLEARPSVIQATITPVAVPTVATTKPEEKTVASTTPAVVPNANTKLISVTVTPDISHMLPSPQENCQSRVEPLPKQPTNNNTSMNNNNVVNSRIINLGNANNATLLQLYANANAVLPPQTNCRRLSSPQLMNGRIPPPKVTQSRSIFSHSEKMVYGNPKDIILPQKHLPPPPRNNHVVGAGQSVLDLTQRPDDKPAFSRPSLEIVRVPVVPRPNPLNYDTSQEKSADLSKKSFNYPNMLDTRTMVSNNLEITLVNPKHNSHPQQLPPQNLPARNNVVSPQRRTPNGKYPMRSQEPLSPYTPEKPNHMVIPNIPNIPNIASIPNLNHYNNVANSPYARTPQQHAIDRRKAEASKEYRRSSESDRSLTPQQERQNDVRRHTAPNVPAYSPSMNPNPPFLPHLANHGKFLPMLDPVYFSLYNGIFPPPIPPTASFPSPEFSAYYKELVASQSRLTMTGQPAVPTSK